MEITLAHERLLNIFLALGSGSLLIGSAATLRSFIFLALVLGSFGLGDPARRNGAVPVFRGFALGGGAGWQHHGEDGQEQKNGFYH